MSLNNNQHLQVPQQLEDMFGDLDVLMITAHDQTVRSLTGIICRQYFNQEVGPEIKAQVAKKVVERFDKAVAEWYADGSYKDFEY